MSKLASVYIMEDHGGALKIGHSVDPTARRRQLGSHLRVVHVGNKRLNADRVEHLAHRLLEADGKSVGGEMFVATLSEVRTAIECAERMADGIEPLIASTSKYPYKRIIQLDDAMKAAIRDFRFEHKLMSDAEAIRQLVAAGLQANGERGEAKRSARR